MQYSGIEDKDYAESCLNELDKAVVEYGTDNYRKQRHCPKRDKVTVRERYDTAHYYDRKGNDPVFRNIGTRIESVGKPGNQIQKAVYRNRQQYPEFDITVQGLPQIIDEIVIEKYAYLKRCTNDRHYEKDLLVFKSYRSLQIPKRGILDRLAIHMQYLVRLCFARA